MSNADAVSERWTELAAREVPAWFHDAKLGIFLHWGLYSVPAWAPRTEHINEIISRSGVRGFYRMNPYAEWYLNSSRVPGSPTWDHHRRVHGGRDYYEFASEFDQRAAVADIDGLAGILRDAGAEYVILTSKHHDGFTLWPSDVSHPRGTRLQAGRDLVGDLSESVRAAGMRMGLYYSGGYDWSIYDRVLRRNADVMLGRSVDPAYEQYATAHIRELIERYRPSVLWNDIGWPAGTDLAALFTEYYSQVPDGVVNDRWTEGPTRRGWKDVLLAESLGRMTELFWSLLRNAVAGDSLPSAKHADFVTPEYQTFAEIRSGKWEQTRGIGHSFALNVNEQAEDMISVEELIHNFVDVVSKNGNLLLGVGPAADGTIPDAQLRVLEQLGTWLRTNGPAVKGTRPWHTAEGRTDRGQSLRYTQSESAVYAIMLDAAPAPGQHVFEEISVRDAASGPLTVELLGVGPVDHAVVGGRLAVTIPERLAAAPAHALRISGV